jgi:hypothetical protein
LERREFDGAVVKQLVELQLADIDGPGDQEQREEQSEYAYQN